MRLRSSTPRRARVRPPLIATTQGLPARTRGDADSLVGPDLDAEPQGVVHPAVSADRGPAVVTGVRPHALL
jgi:hypothetical protein